MKNHLRIVAAFAALTLMAAACGDDDDQTATVDDTATGGEDRDQSGPTETDTLKFGAIISQSGQLAAIAQPSVDALELAVAQINDAGGIEVGDIRYEVELVLEDDRSDPGVATAAATGLIEDEDVNFILGPGTSVTAPAVAQLVVPKGVIMLTPSTAVASMLTPDQVESSSKTLFLTNSSNEELGDGFQRAFEEAFPDARTAAILLPDSGIGQSIRPLYETALDGAGVELVASETFPAGSTDVTTALTSIRSSRPDVLITGVTTPEVSAVTAQAVEFDVAPAIFVYNGSLNIPLVDATGSPIDQRFVTFGLPGTLETLKTTGEVVAPRDDVKQVAADIEEVLGHESAAYSAPALYLYDFVFMLAEAIEQAGTVDDTGKIADALAGLSYDGVIGPITFSPTHTAQIEGDVCIVEAGEIECTLLES